MPDAQQRSANGVRTGAGRQNRINELIHGRRTGKHKRTLPMSGMPSSEVSVSHSESIELNAQGATH